MCRRYVQTFVFVFRNSIDSGTPRLEHAEVDPIDVRTMKSQPRPKMALPKKVWRISETAPMGEWVNKDAPPVAKPSLNLPDVSSGTWVISSYDLLDGTDVTEEVLPDDLFEELFTRQPDAPPDAGK
jgi:hypothetical protein